MPDVSSGIAVSLSQRAVEGGIGRISLPKPLTSFIGREDELAQAKRLLQDSYLVTLTGPGGSGKTRLCIALAAAVAGDYPDGDPGAFWLDRADRCADLQDSLIVPGG